jgi:hypothetical protein
MGFRVPDGYTVVETNQRVRGFSGYPTRYWTRRGAQSAVWRAFVASKEIGAPPSHRLVVERRGFMDYRVVAYQNQIVPLADPSESII